MELEKGKMITKVSAAEKRGEESEERYYLKNKMGFDSLVPH